MIKEIQIETRTVVKHESTTKESLVEVHCMNLLNFIVYKFFIKKLITHKDSFIRCDKMSG
jgi:hypothetical protein